MSILIKGMAMPTSCSDCKLQMAVGCCGNLPHNTRMPNCPLIELPPHGKWIFHNEGFGFTHHCSNCNFEVKEQWIDFYNFCPNCGADMRESEGEDEYLN